MRETLKQAAQEVGRLEAMAAQGSPSGVAKDMMADADRVFHGAEPLGHAEEAASEPLSGERQPP
jgi:hypothetical protein